ncbi:MAG TPA: multicopper oxidase domain-containing protein [Vicinamibacterales bacterium]
MQRHPTIGTFAIGIVAACVLFLGLRFSMTAALARQTPAPPAQTPAPATNCQSGQDLITIPEIASDASSHRLRAEIRLTSGKRALWGSVGDTRCVQQDMRYFTGRSLLTSGKDDPAFSTGEPLPGPTLRARVGDLIEVRFLNQVDPQSFANTLDQADTNPANTTGCDEVRSDAGGLIYPNPSKPGTVGDVMPNCLHGSSTANLHFHGTHTTPSTTGDNILLFVTPALRGKDRKQIRPNDAFVDQQFKEIFSACEKDGTPTAWKQLPATWRTDQERLLREYDKTAPYEGKPGNLPHDMQLWPHNDAQIAAGVWPQYQLGASPYCFRLADAKATGGRPAQVMGQAPGTHWYHAHKHGSTALNVANGMTGAFIIEGQYDDDLRKFYGSDLKDQVLVVQQLSTTPFPALAPRPVPFNGPGSIPKPQLSVNGRLNPIVRMRPGEVQRWRIVNAAYRSAVQFQSIAPAGGLAWRQIAQDGVQFAYANYTTLGAMSRAFNLAPANRADILVRASEQTGTYTLTVQANEGLALDPTNLPIADKPVVLLTVKVEGTPVRPAKDFIQREADFPVFPDFLTDITSAEIAQRRAIDFGAAHNLIDGKTFNQNRYSQVMELNDAEEWTITNQANDKAHPFHIHINPFQITEVFQPNLENTKNPSQPCYVDPLNPQTWKPCTPLTGPFVWWDTFAIPPSAALPIGTSVCTTVDKCPAAIQQYTACTAGQCTVTIPGRFRMRTKFVDYTGAYVIHCHILIHEDRGMMQLIEVVPDKPPYTHK